MLTNAMRRILVVAAVALVAAAIAPFPSAAQTPVQDSVSGDVTLGGDSTIHRLTIDARSGPSGEDPTGTVSTSGIDGQFSGTVTCLNVVGNDATVVYRVPGFQQPSAVEIVDFAGTPGQPDVVAFPILSDPADCRSAPTRPRFPVAITSGDLVVTDAPPFPTSIDQCRNGGWRNYGFSNQGRCVAFVIKEKLCAAFAKHHVNLPFCPPKLSDS
jgi:hypothetical protein